MCQVPGVNVHVSSARRQRSCVKCQASTFICQLPGVNVHVSRARRQRSCVKS
uniref:Uncharacterized protein n=1 Tax=Meloidogyne enterolobii TaxID=390850 RepID=A0A6V7Y4Z9_MELEN|nr:unnamed protein product [Meloidogyne enterolobii]